MIELTDEDYEDLELERIADGLWAESLFAGNPPSLMQPDDRAMWLRLAKIFTKEGINE